MRLFKNIFKKETFRPKSKDEELEILVKDDDNFTNAENYLKPLIHKIMKRHGFDEKDKKVYMKITEAMRTAAKFYLSKGGVKEEYKFSTYFSWWAIETIKREKKQPGAKN